MSPQFWDWYNIHISPRWWASSAMWVGIFAGLVEFLPDYIQRLLDSIDLFGDIFDWSDTTKRAIQAILLFIVLPIAKAWKQKKTEKAVIQQATDLGLVEPLPKSGVTGVTVRGGL